MDKKQILIIIGFLLVLISIPITLFFLKQTQIFKSRASELKPNTTLPRVASTSANLNLTPTLSPLEGIKALLQASLTPAPPSGGNQNPTNTPSPTPTDVVIAFGPTLRFKIKIEGRPSQNQATKAFVGIMAGNGGAGGKYLLTYSIDIPSSGEFRGLSLAGLNPGSTYTAYIKGASTIASSSTFVMGPTETYLNSGQALALSSGDLNDDNIINNSDYSLAYTAYLVPQTSPNWNPKADINADGVVNSVDLSIIRANLGKTGAPSAWYSPPPNITPSPTSRAGGIEESAGYWLWVPGNN